MTTLTEPQAADTFTPERLLRLFTTAPKAFWRFDVDVSLARAVDMAQLAQIAGIRGVFYVMCRSPFYNPFSSTGLAALEAIHAANQRVGLHIDYRGGDVLGVVNTDQDLARRGARRGLFYTELVSFHMPPPDVLWRDFYGFHNAYGTEWEGRYLSDSRREWGPDKEARVTNDMQIALHAEHWFE